MTDNPAVAYDELIANANTDQRYLVFVFGRLFFTSSVKVIGVADGYLEVGGAGVDNYYAFAVEYVKDGSIEFRRVDPPPLW